MKKIFMSSIVLFAFSLSIITFQIACKKEAVAETVKPTLVQLNKILYSKGLEKATFQLFIADYDGGNAKKINLQMPTTTENYEFNGFKLSPDGTKLFSDIYFLKDGKRILYSWNVDGSNMKQIVEDAAIEGVY